MKEAATIRHIFKAVVNGLTVAEILQWLNTNRYTTKCDTRKTKKECSTKSVRWNIAEGIVMDELEKLLSERGIEKMVDYLISKIEKLSKEMSKEIKDLKKKLIANEKQINTLVDALLSGVNSDTSKHKINSLEAEKNNIIGRIEYYEDSVKASSIPKKDHIHAYPRKIWT